MEFKELMPLIPKNIMLKLLGAYAYAGVNMYLIVSGWEELLGWPQVGFQTSNHRNPDHGDALPLRCEGFEA